MIGGKGEKPTADVDARLARILDARPSPTIPESIAQIDAQRSATRHVIEAEGLTVRQRAARLIRLASLARDTDLPQWSQRAIWEEAREWFGQGDVTDLPSPDYETRQRVLRFNGYDRCPACLALVLTDSQLSHQTRRRGWAVEDRAVRREAVKVG
jgi:hypothetical protein